MSNFNNFIWYDFFVEETEYEFDKCMWKQIWIILTVKLPASFRLISLTSFFLISFYFILFYSVFIHHFLSDIIFYYLSSNLTWLFFVLPHVIFAHLFSHYQIFLFILLKVFVVSAPDDVLECLEEHHLHLQVRHYLWYDIQYMLFVICCTALCVPHTSAITIVQNLLHILIQLFIDRKSVV